MAKSKPWNHARSGRREAKLQRRRVLIVCEDSKSSCHYFQAFEVDRSRVEIVAVGTGMNTDSLVEHAISLQRDAERRNQPFNQVWCVFDRDDFPERNFIRAFELARANRIKVAWANQAFELWYLLHFNYHDTAIERTEYKRKLAEAGLNYEKSDPLIYATLKPKQTTALKNARRLESYWNELPEKFPERQNPSTSLHKLVEFLNSLADLGGV